MVAECFIQMESAFIYVCCLIARKSRVRSPEPGNLCVWGLHVLSKSAWVLSGSPVSSHSPENVHTRRRER